MLTSKQDFQVTLLCPSLPSLNVSCCISRVGLVCIHRKCLESNPGGSDSVILGQAGSRDLPFLNIAQVGNHGINSQLNTTSNQYLERISNYDRESHC